jgi:PIN domain nuclease of toxin-antitoxin system
MNLLLDTHVLLWWMDASPSLSQTASEKISDVSNIVFVSAAVVWEIRIRQALGKLRLPADFRQVLARQPFEKLPITADHAHPVGDLPSHHRAPFDRMLIAQAKVEGLTIVTHDSIFHQYRIPIVEA